MAQDPHVKGRDGAPLLAQVAIRAEPLDHGPCGARVHVIDYDISSNIKYRSWEPRERAGDRLIDPFSPPDARFAREPASNGHDDLTADPRFAAQNVYAILMRTLERFEAALGRRVPWSFGGHQIRVFPHAFREANAFYSPDDAALFFGYFPDPKSDRTIYTALSHDIIVHEGTHALLDGLRPRFIEPSSPDQGAFHEGFADVVALLMVFSLPDVVKSLLGVTTVGGVDGTSGCRGVVPAEAASGDMLGKSVLLGLADQMGTTLSSGRRTALRRSVMEIDLREDLSQHKEFQEPHRRGELLVAAMMNAFLAVWRQRLEGLAQLRLPRPDDPGEIGLFLDADRVAEEGAIAAETLLTSAIRALDYLPPLHMKFGDFLSALLTADYEVRPHEGGFAFRERVFDQFRALGIPPAAPGGPSGPRGTWLGSEEEHGKVLQYEDLHFDAMRSDPEEIFHFMWANRAALRLTDGVNTRVLSVNPCVRIAPDGFVLRETVAEYMQQVTLQAGELGSAYGIQRPPGMPTETMVTLHGGGVLVLDEFGRLKFHIHNRLDNRERQNERLDHLWKSGHFSGPDRDPRLFAGLVAWDPVPERRRGGPDACRRDET